jgi:hypothetical protein
VDKTAEAIRTEMDETRSSLSEKLGQLEGRVSDTVRTASAAVTGTTESVKGAIDSIGFAFDIPSHARRHPWIVIGGSVVIGFLAARLTQVQASAPRRVSGARRSSDDQANRHPDQSERSNLVQNDAEFANQSAATASVVAAAYETYLKDTAWQQAKMAAISAAFAAAQQIAVQVVPQVMDHFLSKGRDERSAEDKVGGEHRQTP